jgi:8-oxo-dGTP pyrophosphatase MutT (NUDIX family)
VEPIPAATIILVRGPEIEVLLLRRSRGSTFMANAFVFPGGRVEPGESLEDAAIRETREEASVTIARDALHPWARWVTPVVEPKRFDARFFLAEMPAGQEARFDEKEVVEQVWLAPADALERHRTTDFRLPPPQLRTLWELARCPTMEAMLAESARRAPHLDPIMPHFASGDGGAVSLLLPWDRDYPNGWRADHPLAAGPTRFVLEGMTWRME